MAEVGGEGLEEVRDRLGELSERQAEHGRELFDAIEKRRLEAREQGLDFIVPSPEKILEKLKGGNTPFIFFVEKNYRCPLPGTMRVIVGVDNPDPVQQGFIFVHLFFGPGGVTADVGQALALADTRFPRATEPTSPGLFLPPYSSEGVVVFYLPISGRIEESNYFVNLFLIQMYPSDLGQVLDRINMPVLLRDRPLPVP